MEILEDFLSEQEVLDMDDKTLHAFVSIFGQELFAPLTEYMNSPEANPEVLMKLEEVVGDVISRNTFHTKVKDRNLQTTIYENRLKTLPERIYSNSVDVDMLIENLEWLDSHKDSLTATLPIRTNDMYKKAYGLILEYEKNPNCAHDHPISKNMEQYKDLLFCPKKAKAVPTGMSGLSMNKSYWKMQLKAAQYLRFCQQNGISQQVAKEV